MYNHKYILIILVIIMYVRVEYKGKSYYSYVFAYFKYDYMDQYVVFDSIDNKFDIVSYFSLKSNGHRQIGFMNENEDNFVYVKELNLNMGLVEKCAGYPWIIENVNLIKDIEEGNPIDIEYINIAKNMNLTINPDAWNEVETKEDAEDMMNHVGGFHDWYLVGIEAKSDPYDCDFISKVQLKFTSQAAFDVLVEFDGAYIKYNFCSANRIYLSTVIVDEYVYWIDGEENVDLKYIEDYQYIQGNKLRWKFILKDKHSW